MFAEGERGGRRGGEGHVAQVIYSQKCSSTAWPGWRSRRRGGWTRGSGGENRAAKETQQGPPIPMMLKLDFGQHWSAICK